MKAFLQADKYPEPQTLFCAYPSEGHAQKASKASKPAWKTTAAVLNHGSTSPDFLELKIENVVGKFFLNVLKLFVRISVFVWVSVFVCVQLFS